MGRVLLLIVGFVVALGLAGASLPPPEQQRGAQQTEGRNQTSAPTLPIRVVVENAEEDRGCEDRRDNLSSDLCAQWKAADAAKESATWTRLTFWAGVLGTVFLVWTLWETRQAAQREQRAYVRVEPSGEGAVKAGQRIRLPLKVDNYGTTPARDLSFQQCIVVRKTGWTWDDEPKGVEEGNRTYITLHPGSPMMVAIEMDDPLPEDVHGAICRGEACVFAKGTVHYRDVFGQKRKTVISMEFSGDDCVNSGALRMAAHGNIAT